MTNRVSFIFSSFWSWILDTGLDLAILLVLAMLVPRLGRLAMRVISHRVENAADFDSSKNHLAFAGVGVYIAQMIAFFILIVLTLQQVGFTLAGAAIPATVVSAAIGFGAQSIIADFLAGFFILTEKQFGVGDWVRFEGSGISVEGTVIEITMRATRIRTIAQETVIIPNSVAKVCINNSNNWSRAVVVIPIPMLGSQNISEVIWRSEDATRRALAQTEISKEVLGELDVHPAIDVTPPTVVGMPWMVTMRFLVQVTAGNQWMVERAIRTQIISEFWSEYGSATTTSGTFIDTLTTDDAPTSALLRGAPEISTGAGSARHTTELIDETPTTISPNRDATIAEMAASSAEDPEADPSKLSPGNPEANLDNSPDLEAELSQPDVSPMVKVEDEPAETTKKPDHSVKGFFRTDSYEKPWQKALSLGGRIRMSTMLIILGLGVLLILKSFTLEPVDGFPEAPTTSETTEPAVSSSVEAPTPVEETPTSSVDTLPATPPTETSELPQQSAEEPTAEGQTSEPSTSQQLPGGSTEVPTPLQTTQAPSTQSAPTTAQEPVAPTTAAQ